MRETARRRRARRRSAAARSRTRRPTCSASSRAWRSRTPNIDYNGRYCMASAAAGQNRAFGIDRGLPFPVERHRRDRRRCCSGARTAPRPCRRSCSGSPRSGTEAALDRRRSAPHGDRARRPTSTCSSRPGPISRSPTACCTWRSKSGLIDEAYIAARTDGFDDAAPGGPGVPPGVRRAAHRVSPSSSSCAPCDCWPRRSSACCSRAAAPSSSRRASTPSLAFINLMLALGKVGKPASGYGCLTGQGNGQGGREHGQKGRPAPRLPAHRRPGASRRHRARSGASTRGAARQGQERLRAPGRARPEGRHPRASGVRVERGGRLAERAATSTERLAVARPAGRLRCVRERDVRAAHVFLPIGAVGRGGRHDDEPRGARHLAPRVSAPPPGVKTDSRSSPRSPRASDVARRLSVRGRRGAVFDELRRATAGGKADYSGITYARIDREQGVFWPCPAEDHPGTPRLFAERFAHPSGRARFHAVRHRPAAELPDAEYPLYLHDRPLQGALQLRRADAACDRAAWTPSPSRGSRSIRTSPARLGVADGEPRRSRADAARSSSPSLSARDIRPTRCSRPFTGAGGKRANMLTIAALDPTSRMPEFKVCAVARARRRSVGASACHAQRRSWLDHRQRNGHLPPARRARRARRARPLRDQSSSARSRAARTTASCSARSSPARRPTRSSPSRPSGTTRTGSASSTATRVAARHLRQEHRDRRRRAPAQLRRRRPRDGEPAARAAARGHDDGRRRAPPRRLRLPDHGGLPAHPRARRGRATAPSSSAAACSGSRRPRCSPTAACTSRSCTSPQDADERPARRDRRRDARRARSSAAGSSCAPGARSRRSTAASASSKAFVLDDGTTLPADMVVLACGVRPRVDLARASGLPVNKGIVVNDTLATEVPGVYAFGECAEHDGKTYGIVAPVWEQAAVLADVLSGTKTRSRATAARSSTRGSRSRASTSRRWAGSSPSSRATRSSRSSRSAATRTGSSSCATGKLVGAMLVGNTDAAASARAALRSRRSAAGRSAGGALPGALVGAGGARRAPRLQLSQGDRVAALREAIAAGATPSRRSARRRRPAPAAARAAPISCS